MHVPDLRSNLISVAKITDCEFKVFFSKEAAEVINGHGSVKMVADRVGDLYFVRERIESAQNLAVKELSAEPEENKLTDHLPKHGTEESAI